MLHGAVRVFRRAEDQEFTDRKLDDIRDLLMEKERENRHLMEDLKVLIPRACGLVCCNCNSIPFYLYWSILNRRNYCTCYMQ